MLEGKAGPGSNIPLTLNKNTITVYTIIVINIGCKICHGIIYVQHIIYYS